MFDSVSLKVFFESYPSHLSSSANHAMPFVDHEKPWQLKI